MAKPWVIYTLSDPRAPEAIRYVGKTCRKPEYRLKGHLHYARGPANTKLTCWIRSLLKDNVLPAIGIIDVGSPEEDWAEAERKWIAHYRTLGHRLVNGTDGGEGGLGHIVSAETRDKISMSNKGRFPSAETRLKQSEAKKGKPLNLKPDSHVKATATRKSRIASGEIVVTHSPESIEKRADSCRKTWRLKIANGWTVPDNWSRFRPDNRGHAVSEETRKKIGDANRGRVIGVDGRLKMSAAKKGKTPHNKGLGFIEARRIVRELGIKNLKEHHAAYDAGLLPKGVVRNPQVNYAAHPEWKGQRDFFGAH